MCIKIQILVSPSLLLNIMITAQTCYTITKIQRHNNITSWCCCCCSVILVATVVAVEPVHIVMPYSLKYYYIINPTKFSSRTSKVYSCYT